MRVAFFTDSFLPTHDGVAQVTSSLAHALARRGVHVVVHTVRIPGTARHSAEADGVEVVRYRAVAAPSYPQYRIALFPWFPLAKGSSGGPADIAHIHTPGFVGLAGWWASRRWGIPSVGTFHTNLPEMLRGSPRGRSTQWFFTHWGEFSRRLCLGCDVATAPTVEAARQLEGRGPQDPPGLVRVIGNGVDPARFHPGVPEPNWAQRLGTEGPIVAFVGRLTRDKGVLQYLDALEGLPRSLAFQGVVAGEGPLRPVLEERIASSEGLAGRVRYLGAIPEEEKPGLLAQSRAFVLPSTADTSSVALLEAMASGAACVVTRRGGPANLVDPGITGVPVDPKSIPEIRNAIGGLLSDSVRAAEMGRRAAAWVRENATVEKVADAYLHLYEELARGRQGDLSRRRREPGRAFGG